MAISVLGGELHAWNLLGGRVYDETWQTPWLNKYFGVAFTPEFKRFMEFTTGFKAGYTHVEQFYTAAPYLENYGKNWKMP